MKKYVLGLIMVSMLGLTACSKVEPAHYGKKLTGSGYLPEVLEPGKYFKWPWESIVKLDASTHMVELPLGVTMRDENSDGSSRIGLDMDFSVALRYKMRSDPQVINTMFNDIVVQDNYLSGEKVFETYGRVIVENKVRELLSRYTPEEALNNREFISSKLSEDLDKAFASKPISIQDVVISKMVLPPVIVKRINSNKDRELSLAQAQAQQRIDLEERSNQIVLAQKEAEKRLIDAQAASAENKELNSGLTDNVLALRKLEIQKVYADAWKACMLDEGKCGSNTVYMPFEAMQSTGANVRMYAK